MKEDDAISALRKGMLLVVKTPPYYSREYLYEITSAGEKLIRAALYHSPTVKKSWTNEELSALIDLKIIRLASDEDVKQLSNQTTTTIEPDD